MYCTLLGVCTLSLRPAHSWVRILSHCRASFECPSHAAVACCKFISCHLNWPTIDVPVAHPPTRPLNVVLHLLQHLQNCHVHHPAYLLYLYLRAAVADAHSKINCFRFKLAKPSLRNFRVRKLPKDLHKLFVHDAIWLKLCKMKARKWLSIRVNDKQSSGAGRCGC